MPLAHVGHWAGPTSLAVLLGATVVAAGYAAAASVGPGGVATWRRRAFAAGLAVVVLASVGPIDEAANRSFTGHMVQHLVLMLLAAPLLVAGMPLRVLRRVLRGRPSGAVRAVERAGWRLRRRVAGGLAAAVALAAAFAAWHVPAAYDAAVGHDAVHLGEHVTLVAGAVPYWWVVLAPRPRPLVVLVAATTASVLGGAGGLVLALVGASPYAAFEGASAVDDVRLGGAVMAMGGLVNVAIAGGAIAAWLSALAPTDPGGTIGTSRSTRPTGAAEPGRAQEPVAGSPVP